MTSLFNYDLSISLCETSLNDSVELPDSYLQDDYLFISSNKHDRMIDTVTLGCIMETPFL